MLFGTKFKKFVEQCIASHRGLNDIIASKELQTDLQIIKDVAASSSAAAEAPPVVVTATLSDDENTVDTKTSGMVAAAAKLPGVPEQDLEQFASKAEKIVNRHLSIIVYPTKGSLSKAIQEHPVGKTTGKVVAPVLIHYAQKRSGEAEAGVQAPAAQ